MTRRSASGCPRCAAPAGFNYARTINVPASAASAFGLIYSGQIFAEPLNSNREDNIWVFDVRAEKTINFTARTRPCSSNVLPRTRRIELLPSRRKPLALTGSCPY